MNDTGMTFTQIIPAAPGTLAVFDLNGGVGSIPVVLWGIDTYGEVTGLVQNGESAYLVPPYMTDGEDEAPFLRYQIPMQDGTIARVVMDEAV